MNWTLGSPRTLTKICACGQIRQLTHAKDKIIDRDDPQLLDPYQKQAGFQIGQYRSQINTGYYNTWDEVYAAALLTKRQQ
jgi:hypothetical protein